MVPLDSTQLIFELMGVNKFDTSCSDYYDGHGLTEHTRFWSIHIFSSTSPQSIAIGNTITT